MSHGGGKRGARTTDHGSARGQNRALWGIWEVMKSGVWSHSGIKTVIKENGTEKSTGWASWNFSMGARVTECARATRSVFYRAQVPWQVYMKTATV